MGSVIIEPVLLLKLEHAGVIDNLKACAGLQGWIRHKPVSQLKTYKSLWKQRTQ